MYKYAEIVEERVGKNMDPILTIGLLAFVFVVSFNLGATFKAPKNLGARVTSITPVTLDDIASYFFLQNAREQL